MTPLQTSCENHGVSLSSARMRFGGRGYAVDEAPVKYVYSMFSRIFFLYIVKIHSILIGNIIITFPNIYYSADGGVLASLGLALDFRASSVSRPRNATNNSSGPL